MRKRKKQNPSSFKYYSMKYQNNLSNEFAEIINDNSNSIKVASKTYNNLIK